jgi:hypothetical protein
VGQKRLALHEKTGKMQIDQYPPSSSSHPDPGSACIRKSSASGAQTSHKRLKYLHTSKNHSSTLRRIAISVPAAI